MVERFWTMEQMPQLLEVKEQHLIPDKVVEGIQKVIEILDTYYGEERNVDNDDGGYVLLILTNVIDELNKEYQKILEQFLIKEEEAEFKDIVYEDERMEWHSDLFLISNEYGVTIVYALRKENAL